MLLVLIMQVNGQTDPERINKQLEKLAENFGNAEINVLATTPGDNKLKLLQIGSFKDGEPSVFVAANITGNIPTASDGAIWFAEYLLHNYTEGVNWYILPVGSPDAYNRFFDELKWDSPTNLTPVNSDNDELIDEDGPDDLNKDGYITQMLVEHPLGEYVKDTADERIIRKANKIKGEQGKYKLYTEGIDNDGDGKYNEDAEGGVNIDCNFTYDYKPFVPEHGKWKASEEETISIIRFFAEHSDIAMAFVIGSNNTLLFPPEIEKSEGETEKIKVPGYYNSWTGIDTTKTYTKEELREEISSKITDKAFADNIYKSLINRKAPKNIEKEDIKFYHQISKEYKVELKKNNFNTSVEKPVGWGKGSFEKFCYFQYGLPTFSVNPWLLPVITPKEKKELLKKTFDQRFLEYADSNQINVFVDWQKINHPDFDNVEVGGFIPYIKTTPPVDSMEILFEKQLPFILSIAKKLPELKIELKTEQKSKDLIQVEVYVSNIGELPYPTAMGARNSKPAPVILKVNGIKKLLSGTPRINIGQIESKTTKKFVYLIEKKDAKNASFELERKNVKCTNPVAKIEML